MKVIKEYLVIGVGVLLTIVFILVMVSASDRGKNMVNDAMSQADDVFNKYSDIELAIYDNTTVSGDVIIGLINELDANTTYSVKVKNGASTSYTEYRYSTDPVFAVLKSNITDKAQTAYYINPGASFYGKLNRDANGQVTSISFEQK